MEKAKTEAVSAPKEPTTVLELLEEDDEFEVCSLSLRIFVRKYIVSTKPLFGK